MGRMQGAVISLTIVASACGSSTTAPSSSFTAPAVTSAAISLQPLLAQLGQVENALTSANHHLVVVTSPGDPCAPGDPCFTNHLESALDFYQKGNDRLDDLVQRISPTDPCLPAFVAGVHAIVVQTTQTHELLGNTPPNPIRTALENQLAHTVSVTGGALRCGVDHP